MGRLALISEREPLPVLEFSFNIRVILPSTSLSIVLVSRTQPATGLLEVAGGLVVLGGLACGSLLVIDVLLVPCPPWVASVGMARK